MTKPPNKTPKTAVPGKKSKKAALSDEDLWTIFSSKITPLSEAERNWSISSLKSSYPPKPKKKQSQPRPSPPPAQPLDQRLNPKPPMQHGHADGLDRASRKRMRRGQVLIEARLDLHGMIQTEAHRSLTGFLERAYLSGKRSVLVITGKGLRLSGETGVLRNAVPKWLNEPPLRNWVRGFDYAAPSDGGEGALYVLLRRKR